MRLFFRTVGKGQPLIILHGLFGMSDNWMSVGKQLSRYFRVFLLDLRNHGKSPHHPEFDYPVMVRDLVEFIREQNLKNVNLLGHSMGGKVSMLFALNHPESVNNLIVADIAPRAYNHPYFKQFLELLLKLDVSNLKTRAEADRFLSRQIPQTAIRQFLLKNLQRDRQNRFYWKINLQAVYRNLDRILEAVRSERPFTGRALFLRGEFSDYISNDDFEEIYRLFPKAQIKTVPKATHWVHADAPKLLIENILEFIKPEQVQ
ncbi:MAG: alpha/beta fold hydrolase [Calditrichaeota bacterium]|nr:alpha/beta fold hydrolase [Calditrichota bacterium]